MENKSDVIADERSELMRELEKARDDLQKFFSDPSVVKVFGPREVIKRKMELLDTWPRLKLETSDDIRKVLIHFKTVLFDFNILFSAKKSLKPIFEGLDTEKNDLKNALIADYRSKSFGIILALRSDPAFTKNAEFASKLLKLEISIQEESEVKQIEAAHSKIAALQKEW